METRIVGWLNEHRSEMFGLLERLVRIQSGSRNKAGVDEMVEALEEVVGDLAKSRRRIAETDCGDHLLIECGAPADESGILMMGHMDTVFPADTHFRDYREDDQRAYGPGVIDMKGGLVVAIFALKALARFSLLEQIPVRMLFNSDEEIGSFRSEPIIRALAARSRFALVFECGGLNGEVVTGRKGRLGFRLRTKGQAGHAAAVTAGKKSAVLEMAHKIIALEGLNDAGRGLSVNVGWVRGGIGPNSVPETAEADVDIRFLSEEQAAAVQGEVERIAGRQWVEGVVGHIEESSNRPPMPQTEGNRKLFSVLAEVAGRLNIRVKEELRSGGSDASLIAREGVPVIDGLGPIGAMDHSDKEYMIKDSLVERAALTALSIVEGWRIFAAAGSIRL